MADGSAIMNIKDGNKEDCVYKYSKEKELRSLLTAMAINLIVAFIGTIFIYYPGRIIELNYTNVVIIMATVALLYDACSFFQLYLKLTGNYILAFIVFVLTSGAILYFAIRQALNIVFLNQNYTPLLMYDNIDLLLLLMVPFFTDLYNTVKLWLFKEK